MWTAWSEFNLLRKVTNNLKLLFQNHRNTYFIIFQEPISWNYSKRSTIKWPKCLNFFFLFKNAPKVYEEKVSNVNISLKSKQSFSSDNPKVFSDFPVKLNLQHGKNLFPFFLLLPKIIDFKSLLMIRGNVKILRTYYTLYVLHFQSWILTVFKKTLPNPS